MNKLNPPTSFTEDVETINSLSIDINQIESLSVKPYPIYWIGGDRIKKLRRRFFLHAKVEIAEEESWNEEEPKDHIDLEITQDEFKRLLNRLRNYYGRIIKITRTRLSYTQYSKAKWLKVGPEEFVRSDQMTGKDRVSVTWTYQVLPPPVREPVDPVTPTIAISEY